MVHELSYNVDGIWRSSYFHKQSTPNGNKVFAGPLWDFDLAYGNADLREADPRGRAARQGLAAYRRSQVPGQR
jgi:hypothetical protein